MATNAVKGGGGKRAVKESSQLQNLQHGLWIKRDIKTERFLDVTSSSSNPFKGIRKEK